MDTLMHFGRRTCHLLGRLVALVLLGTGAVSAQGPTVTVNGPRDVDPGATVQARIDLSQVANLGALFFDLTYDPAQMTLQGVSATGNLASQGLFATNPEAFPSSTGRVRFGFLHADGLGSDGTFVTVTFQLAAGAPSPAPLSLEGATALDGQASTLTATAVNGSVEVLLAGVDLKSGLRLFTVPVTLANGDPAAVLGEPAASVRLAAWDPAAKEGQGDYVLYNGTNVALQAGRSYWLLGGADKQLRVRAGTPIDAASAFAVSLAKGWNLLGNPYKQAVSWSLSGLKVRKGTEEKTLADAYSAGWIEDYAWAWQQDTADPNTGRYALVYDTAAASGLANQVEPWAGCWVRANEACDLVLSPPNRSRARARNRDKASSGWSVRVLASSDAGSAEVALGVGAGSRGKAVGLPPEPPSGRAALRMASILEGQPLALDLRDALAGGQEWELRLETPEAESGSRGPREVTLSWPNMRALPKDVTLTLVDPATGTRRYLRTVASHTVRLDEGARSLRLVAERRTGPAIAVTGLDVVQAGRATGTRTVRFQLSAPAAVDVDFLSPTGRALGTVTRAQACASGANQVTWSGALSPGIYLVRVRATTEEGASAQAVRATAVTR